MEKEVVNHHGDSGIFGASSRFESGGGCEHWWVTLLLLQRLLQMIESNGYRSESLHCDL